LTGLYNTWLWTGFALGPLVGGFLVDSAGFRPAMLACAGLTALGLAVAVVALPETAQRARGNTQRGARPVLSLGHRLSEISRRWVRTLLRDKRSLVTVSWLLLITQFAGEGVALSTISLLLQRRFGQSVAVGSVVLGVASAAGVLLALRSLLAGAVGPLAGHLSDTRTGRWPVIVGSLLVGIMGFGLLSFAASLGAIVLGVALGAVSGGTALATLAAQVGDLTPPGREGVVMGAYATAGDIGSMAGPFLAFALLSVVDLQWVYLLCVFAFLFGLGLVCRSRVVQA
jgi:MFS family permease